ncbi:MAG: glycosyltransferase [Endozoicomonas sp.]
MNKSPVIVQIVQHMAPGGIETMVLDLQSCAPEPEIVHIISLEGTLESALENWPRLTHIPRLHFLAKPSGIQLRTVRELAVLLKKLNADVVHTHHVGPMLYGGIAAKLAGCRHVHTEHDAWHLANFKHRLLVAVFFHLFRPAVVADAELVAKSIRQYIPLFSPKVIINGISTSKFTPGDQVEARRELNLPVDVLIIGCAARLTAVKAHDTLISAVALLPADTQLALAGGGELETELKNQAQKAGISDRVHFLGLVEKMASFYRAIDVFCLASKKEGLPLSALEAQASGRNVVLTDVGGCSEAIAPDQGLLVQAGNIESLARALSEQLETGCSDEARGRARQFVLEHGDLSRMLREYGRLYEGCKS